MIETIRELNERRSDENTESGFTLIELLIVIVVLGILAAIVVFALSGVTGQSVSAACQSDAKTVGIGVAALEAENPSAIPTTGATWKTGLLGTSTPALTGAPFLQSWPTGNSTSYTISVAGSSAAATKDSATVNNGDVIVTTPNNTTGTPAVANTYDATVNPVTACQHMNQGQ